MWDNTCHEFLDVFVKCKYELRNWVSKKFAICKRGDCLRKFRSNFYKSQNVLIPKKNFIKNFSSFSIFKTLSVILNVLFIKNLTQLNFFEFHFLRKIARLWIWWPFNASFKPIASIFWPNRPYFCEPIWIWYKVLICL